MESFTNVILVCTHKEASFPKDKLYYPLQLGVDEYNFDLGIGKDNTGDNISYKHRYYSEFSGLYWAWKNIKYDYLGICHYRRFFFGKKKHDEEKRFRRVLSYDELEKLIEHFPDTIFVAPKRNYYIKTLYNHYKQEHNIDDLDKAIELMKNCFPEYYDTFISVLHGTSAHMFNAFIMPKEKMDSYCSFLFSFLSQYEKLVDVSGYSEYQARICGFIGERLLEVWIRKNNVKYKEIKYGFIDGNHFFEKVLKFIKHSFSKRNLS